MKESSIYDVIFVGGGLAAGLAAWQLHRQQPHLKFLIIEQGPTLGGNHVWSFFKTDLTESQFRWIQPLIEHTWPCYEVRFPSFQRQINSTYCSITSEGFHKYLSKILPAESLMLNTKIVDLSSIDITLNGGQNINAHCVIDCRGPTESPHLIFGFQKFTGQLLSLAKPHQLAGPVLMDATIQQDGNYRFFYCLPFSPTEVLVEDTKYSDNPKLDSVVDRKAITKYAEAQGWEIQGYLKEERGILPISLGGDIQAFWNKEPSTARLGLRANLFHATTGYSLPDAVRCAEQLANCKAITSYKIAHNMLHGIAMRHWKEQGFLRLLNRMLFIAAKPDKRYLVLSRFYKLPQALIERFYAGHLTRGDKIRILSGRPPVPIIAALKCLPEYSATNTAKWRTNQRGFTQ